jgi:dTDP-4-dehydrorhamnose reductase
MNILILGKGYIGNYLVNHLSRDKKYNLYHFSKQVFDYTNPSELHNYLVNVNEEIDWVINTSGFTGTPNVDSCEDNKEDCYFYNVTAPLYMTKVCNENNIPIIHIGSGCVYSGYDKIYTEDDLTDFGTDCPTSSTYSKSKDAFEKLSRDLKRIIFRIRIPFNGVYEPKNYLYKLYKYNNLISKQNSITCVDDLVIFIDKFLKRFHKSPDYSLDEAYGIYNVVNSGSVDGASVLDLMRSYDIVNPHWKLVTIKEANFRVERSNCILSTRKLEKMGLALPLVQESLKRAVSNFALNLPKT